MTDNTIKIVLTDDDSDDRFLFQMAIDQIEIKTNLRIFSNGNDLIKYLRLPGTILPDILFLDLNMEGMGGLECLREIKKDPGLKGITVVIYSTSSSEKDIEQTFLAGANIYLNKPSNFEDLKKGLKRVLTTDWQYHTSNLNRNNFMFRF
ncbi:MAG: response regulator [Aquimarina sp.]|nr:response regulator [Aquimarina sp.]